MSSFMSCLLIFSLIIINAVMGIFIGLDIYFMVFIGITLGLTLGLVLFNYKKIFYSKRKIQKTKPVSTTKVSRNRQKDIVRSRRKIS